MTCSNVSDNGGAGGSGASGQGANGFYATSSTTSSGQGLGATQIAAGARPVNGVAAHDGQLGIGGVGWAGSNPSYPGGGGGGGYFGGSGAWLGGGGGGSSWVDTARVTGTTYASTNTGNGVIRLTYLAGATITNYTATNAVNLVNGDNGFISGRSINYSVTFSMPVTGFGPEDITLSGTSGGSGTWTKSAVSGSGAGPYTFTLSNPSAIEGTVIAAVNAAGVIDGNNNVGIGTQTETTTIDTIAPTVTNISFVSGSNVQTAQRVSVTFSETPLSVTTSALTLSGVSASSGTWTRTLVSGSGIGPYLFDINNISAIDGALQVQVAAGNVTDFANNNVVASSLISRNLTLQPSIITGALNTYGGGTITLAPNATVIDRGSSTLDGLRISVTGNAQAGDSLSFTNNDASAFGTIQNATSTSQVLTLTYSGAQPTLAQWQAAIRAVRFTTSTAGVARTIEFHLKPTAGYNYDNMHFYQWVSGTVSTGDVAISNAAGYTYKGMQGYLTTITSAAENAFVYALSGNLGTWLGATQVTANSNNWRWSVGPESGTQFSSGATSTGGMYVNWWAGEPNNSANHVFMTTNGTWDDLIWSQNGAYYNSGNVIEYGSQTSGDPATSILKVTASMSVDATPPTATLAASSATGSTNTNTFTITASAVGIDCSTISPTAGTDFTFSANISSISVAQTSNTVCTITVNSNVASGTTASVTLTRAGTFAFLGQNGISGSMSTASASTSVTIADSVPPVLTFTSQPGAYSNTATLTYNFSVSETIQSATLVANSFTFTGSCTIGAPTLVSGLNYTITLSGCTDSTGVLSLKASTLRDTAGNFAAAVSSNSTIIDRTAPTASFTTKPGAYTTSLSNTPYVVTFSEAVTNMNSTKLSISGSGCQIVNFVANSSTVYSFEVSSCANGVTSTVTLASGAGTDVAGNIGPGSSLPTSTIIDATAPSVVTWSNSQAALTNAATLTYTLTFNEAVSGLAAADFTITGCTSTPTITTSNNITYTITLSGCTSGSTVSVGISSLVVVDQAGTANTAPSQSAISRTLDFVAPVVSWGSNPPSPTKVNSTFSIQFGEEVVGFGSNDITNTGTAQGCVFTLTTIVPGFTFSVLVSSCSDGTLIPVITANSVTDVAGNAGPLANPSADRTAGPIVVDRTAPVATFTSTPPARTNGTLTYVLSFNEAIITTANAPESLSASDFTNAGSATGCAIGVAQIASTNNYTITLSSCSNGTVSLTLADDAVQDIATNAGQVGIIAAGVTVDNTAPTASFTTAPGAYTTATSTRIVVTFSESVTGITASTFTRSGSGCVISAFSATSASVYQFDLSGCADGATGSVTLPANSATDLAGNQGPATALSVSTIFDRTAPSVSSFTTALTSPTNANPLTYTLVFSEAITGLDGSDFTVTGCATQVPTVSTGNGVTHTVSLADCPTAASVAIRFNSGRVADLAGNIGPAANSSTLTLTTDYVQPTIVSFTTSHPATTNANPLVYSLVFS